MFRFIMNSLRLLFHEEQILLGRWNRKHTEIYMDWGNSDNCYNNAVYISTEKNLK